MQYADLCRGKWEHRRKIKTFIYARLQPRIKIGVKKISNDTLMITKHNLYK